MTRRPQTSIYLFCLPHRSIFFFSESHSRANCRSIFSDCPPSTGADKFHRNSRVGAVNTMVQHKRLKVKHKSHHSTTAGPPCRTCKRPMNGGTDIKRGNRFHRNCKQCRDRVTLKKRESRARLSGLPSKVAIRFNLTSMSSFNGTCAQQ